MWRCILHLYVICYFFGINDDRSLKGKDKMAAYCWHEQDSKRGANNIVFCFLKDFRKQEFFWKNYGILTILADNCGSKTRMKQ